MVSDGLMVSEELALFSSEPEGLEEVSDELSEEGFDELSETDVLSLLCGSESFILHAAKANVQQQRERESAKVNSFFIQSS